MKWNCLGKPPAGRGPNKDMACLPLLIKRNPLPGTLPRIQLCRPANLLIDHVQVGRVHGQAVKIDSDFIEQTITSWTQRTQHPLIIEVGSDLLSDDVIGSLKPAGLGNDLNSFGSIFFCADIFNRQGNRLESYVSCPEQNDGQRRLFVNSRSEEGLFLKGLDFYFPLANALNMQKAMAQTEDETLLPFLFSLHSALAIKALMANFPGKNPDDDYPFVGQFAGHLAKVRGQFLQLMGRLPPEAFQLYHSLPGLQVKKSEIA